MNVVRFPKKIAKVENGKEEIIFQDNKGYVLDDYNLYQISKTVSAYDAKDLIINNEYKGEDLTDKSILIYSPGGIGDTLWVTAVLKALKKKYPTCRITVCAQTHVINLIESPLYETIPAWLESVLIKDYDYYLDTNNLFVNTERAKTEHPIDLIAERLSVEITDYRSDIYFTTDEVSKVMSFKLGHDDSDVVIQISSTTLLRELPLDVWIEFVKSKNRRFFIFDKKENKKKLERILALPNVHFLPDYFDTLKEMVCFISYKRLAITVNSSLIVIAGSLGVPLIAVFGSLPSKLRLKGYDAVGIDSNSQCEAAVEGNCFYHGGQYCPLSERIRSYYSPCMVLITTQHINKALEYYEPV